MSIPKNTSSVIVLKVPTFGKGGTSSSSVKLYETTKFISEVLSVFLMYKLGGDLGASLITVTFSFNTSPPSTTSEGSKSLTSTKSSG